ncbi:MAG TPA: response regulator [Nitrospirae bacterium]|nr:response regulator [Nitrospirota bacterium]HDY72516.1 response regulator [Nitrospirota bacterium]
MNINRVVSKNTREKSMYDLNDLVRKSISLIDYQLRKRGVTLSLETSEEPLFIRAAYSSILRGMLHLFLDIIKGFENKGFENRESNKEVRVSAEQRGTKAVIEIYDNVPLSHSRGSRYEQCLPDQLSGFGISLVSKIIENEGGIFSFTETTRGRAFKIELSIVEIDSFSVERGFRVLVLDDEEIVRDVLAGYLESIGHDPVVFGSPIEAAEFLRTDVCDIGIIDLRMPEMNGLDFIKLIERDLPRVRIILLTGDIFSIESDLLSRREKLMVLEKPLTLRKLKSTLKFMGEKINEKNKG